MHGMKINPWLTRSLTVLAVGGVLIQAVPYGRDHTNPAITGAPNWDSPATRELARRACFDCHSNEVHWPWYSHVAPVSWLVQRDVDEGRAVFNVSEWNRPQEEAAESAESVRSGEMPLGPYLWLHPTARLKATETAALIAGLAATFGAKGERAIGSESKDEDDNGEDDG